MSTEFDLEKAIEFFEQRFGSHNCPYCNNINWHVAEKLGTLPTLMNDNSGKLTPLIVVTCTNCGYVDFFNPLVTGLIEKQNIKNEEAQNGETGVKVENE